MNVYIYILCIRIDVSYKSIQEPMRDKTGNPVQYHPVSTKIYRKHLELAFN